MKLEIYQVDAFADKVFAGNPAAIMPLETMLDDTLLQSIALENNLSETAYLVKQPEKGEGHYHLRWFTPATEVDLCGHATLGSAHVLWSKLGETADQLVFETRSGDLIVKKGEGGLIEMDFPANRPETRVDIKGLDELLGGAPLEVFTGAYVMAVLPSAEAVRAVDFSPAELAPIMSPNHKAALIVTAKGEGEADCISRFFAPFGGIDEDPVTGSIHTAIVPYWADTLGKRDITAYQASARGGMLYCTDAGERTIIRGRCADYMQGVVEV